MCLIFVAHKTDLIFTEQNIISYFIFVYFLVLGVKYDPDMFSTGLVRFTREQRVSCSVFEQRERRGPAGATA